MDLKDLPDSELPEMEVVFRALVDSFVITSIEAVWALKDDHHSERSIPSPDELQKGHRRLLLLSDWGFAIMVSSQCFNLVQFPQQHKSLEWLRDQARLKHKEGLATAKKQKINERLAAFSIVASMILSSISILFSFYQSWDSKTDKTFLQALGERTQLSEYRLLRIESQVADFLRDQSKTTTTHQNILSDSLAYQNPVKHK